MLFSVCKSYFVISLMLVCLNVSAVSDAQPAGKFLILGDSLSAAYGLKEQQGWAAMLQQSWRTTHPKVDIVNASVSGATTAAGLGILPGLLSQHQPRWLVLELGANDGLQGKPLPYIRKNLARLITMGQKAGAEVYLLGIRLPPNLGRRYTEPFFQQFADLAKEFNVPYMPFLLEGVAGIDELMQADGLHPNAKGQQKVFSNVSLLLSSWVGRVEKKTQ